MQQQLAVAHDGEHVLLRHQSLRHARRERREFQVRAIDEIVDRHQAIEIDRTVHLVQIVRRQREMAQQEGGDVFRAIERGLQTHSRAVAALCEFALDRAQQVVHFFVVDEQVTVARHAKLPGAFDFHAAEQLCDEGRDDRRQEHEIRFAWCIAALRQADDSRQGARHLHHRELRVTAESVLAGQTHDEVQALVLNSRKRARRVEAQRRQHRFHFLREIFGKPGALCWCERARVHELDSVGFERREDQLIEQLVLIFDQCERAVVNGSKLVGTLMPSGPPAERAEFQPLLQAGDPNLEEFVEVRAGDAQKADALEQWQRLIVCLRQHAVVEIEKRQLPVDVVLGSLEIDVEHGRRRKWERREYYGRLMRLCYRAAEAP